MAADEVPDTIPDTIPYGFVEFLLLPSILWHRFFSWFAHKILEPLVYRYSWYSGPVLRFVNGDQTPCNFTAVVEFSKSIGQPSSLIGRETLQGDRATLSVISWVSKTGKRPLLLVVQWSKKNFSKAHFLHYEDGYLTHSASFGSNATWNQKNVGYPVRRDAVEDKTAFETIANHSHRDIETTYHTRILHEIVKCLRKVKGLEHCLKFDKVERKIFLYTVHRTHLSEEKSISLAMEKRAYNISQ